MSLFPVAEGGVTDPQRMVTVAKAPRIKYYTFNNCLL